MKDPAVTVLLGLWTWKGIDKNCLYMILWSVGVLKILPDAYRAPFLNLALTAKASS